MRTDAIMLGAGIVGVSVSLHRQARYAHHARGQARTQASCRDALASRSLCADC